jgi:fluoride ion exporter CrcB/FEX
MNVTGEFWLVLLAIGLASGLGSVIRSALSEIRGLLGWGIIASNTLAGAVLGGILAIEPSAAAFTILAVGLLGGLSTFSGVAGDAFYFWNRGRLVQLLLTLFANFLLPLAALWMVRNLMFGEW